MCNFCGGAKDSAEEYFKSIRKAEEKGCVAGYSSEYRQVIVICSVTYGQQGGKRRSWAYR